MSMTDPIADMLTKIRNAGQARIKRVDIPSSKTKLGIAKILAREKFIANFKYLTDNKQNVIRVYLRYTDKGAHYIQGLRRASTPGRRLYLAKDRLPRVRNGLGLAIVSTSRGLCTDREARQQGVGGEILCYIW
jgi:small subunit ribosomal protein S8